MNRGRSTRLRTDETIQLYDIEAEKVALGIALSQSVAKAKELLALIPSTALNSDHCCLLLAAQQHLKNNENLDELAIANAARAAGAKNIGPTYIAELQDHALGMGEQHFNERLLPRLHKAANAMKLATTADQIDQLIADGRPEAAPSILRATAEAVEAGGSRHGFSIVPASELATRNFPDVREVIPGLLPVGLTVFAGSPKIGKSWLALGSSWAIAAGGCVLGQFRVERGRVLFLGLEDSPRRLRDRLRRIGNGMKPPDGLDVLDTDSLDRELIRNPSALLAELDHHVKANTNCRLIVIDTLGRIRRATSRQSDLYQHDTDFLGNLQAWAQMNQVAVLALHHTRKADSPEDVFDTVLGTRGVTGVADATWVLRRVRGQGDATLAVTGRDIEECDLGVRWDPSICTWAIVGAADELRLSSARREIIGVLRTSGKPMKPADIARELGKPNPSIRFLLHMMLKDGDVVNDEGRYLVKPSLYCPNTTNGANTTNTANNAIGV